MTLTQRELTEETRPEVSPRVGANSLVESCGARKDSQGHSTNLSESLLESCDVCEERGRTANLRNVNPTRTHFRLLMWKNSSKTTVFGSTCTDDQADLR